MSGSLITNGIGGQLITHGIGSTLVPPTPPDDGGGGGMAIVGGQLRRTQKLVQLNQLVIPVTVQQIEVSPTIIRIAVTRVRQTLKIPFFFTKNSKHNNGGRSQRSIFLLSEILKLNSGSNIFKVEEKNGSVFGSVAPVDTFR